MTTDATYDEVTEWGVRLELGRVLPFPDEETARATVGKGEELVQRTTIVGPWVAAP